MKLVPKGSQVHCWRGNDRGSVLVEFALVTPVLLLLFLAALDFGLVFHDYQVLHNAVREGARFSALPRNDAPLNDPNRGATIAAICAIVIDYCNAEKINPPVAPGEITINQSYPIVIDASVTVRGSQVTVVHTHTFLVGGSFLPGGGALTLQASAVFRNMY
jgi:Flp pilus assembly protein TadG